MSAPNGSAPLPRDDITLQAMLARRTARPVPLDLRIGIERQLDMTRQARAPFLVAMRRRWTADGPAMRLAWAIAVLALLAALAVGTAIVGARLADRPLPAGGGATRVGGGWTYLSTTTSAAAGHAGIGTFTVEADDPEASGNGTFDFGFDQFGATAVTWGDLTITNPGGAWSGSCRGGQWLPRQDDTTWSVALSCWLEGRRAYAGRTLYLQMLGGKDVPMRIDGLIVDGPPPAAWKGR